MSNIVDINKNKSLDETLSSMFSNNCGRDRPRNRSNIECMEVSGITIRDIQDCMVLGILMCKNEEGIPEWQRLPRLYESESGNVFDSLEELYSSDEGFADSWIDHDKAKWNDLYGWDLNSIDPVSAVQNMACYLSRLNSK